MRKRSKLGNRTVVGDPAEHRVRHVAGSPQRTTPEAVPDDHESTIKCALDRDVLRACLRPVEGGEAWEAVTELLQLGARLYVLPLIAEEIEAEGEESERRWREAHLHPVQADDFLRGCAAGMARRYLDYHADPRECRLVAEAECAKMDVLLTLSDGLLAGLRENAENIRLETPTQAVGRLRRRTTI